VAQYVALGHIHRPQRVPAAVAHTEYAGSPLALDFGEAGEEKSFVVVDVVPGQPPTVARVPYEGGKTLGTWAGTLPELEQQAAALAVHGFLRVRLTLDTPLPDLNRRVRQLAPNAVVVEAVVPVADCDPEGPTAGKAPAVGTPVDQFRAYYRREHQREPRPATLALFTELYQLASTE
jgi:DNA repair protein SbcD/Mre11